jgi:chloramphenicol 3-O phosphotransferase
MIILNGGSSSGKSGIARCLQAVLPHTLTAGIRIRMERGAMEMKEAIEAAVRG